jgi:L-serine/L-threonine ammonia-lyase
LINKKSVVGGGGLLSGILEGLYNVGWNDIPILISETKGAESFNISIEEGKLITLPSITSIATTLGARKVCNNVFEWSKKHKIYSIVVDDSEAVNACINFLNDERCLVEPSCGAALASIYSRNIKIKNILEGIKEPIVVVIVCGGSGISLQHLDIWKKQFNL